MAKVEPDPVAYWDADIPYDVLVVGIGLGEVGGGEAAVQSRHVLTQRDAEHREKEKYTTATGGKTKA